MTSRALAKEIAKLTLTKKASDVVIMNMKPLTDMTDYFVICSADSDTQVKAITDAVEDGMRRKETKVWRIEGYQNLQWVLMDFVHVVVHVFQKNVRAFYNLEKLWGDAKIEHVDDEPESVKQIKTSQKNTSTRQKKNETVS